MPAKMDRRRVQEVGGGTVTVSLPHAWAEKHDVSAGTELIVHPHLDGSLELRLTEPSAGAFGTLRLDGSDSTMAAALVRAAFEAGYQRVVLDDADPPNGIDREAVDTVVRALAGIEITEEIDGTVVMEAVLDSEKFSIPQSLRHIHYVLRRLQEHTHEAFENRSNSVEPMIERHAEIQRGVQQIEGHVVRAFVDPDEMDALGEPRYLLYHYTRIAQVLSRAAGVLIDLATILMSLETDTRERNSLLEHYLQASQGLEEGAKAAVRGNSIEKARSALGHRSKLRTLASSQRSDLVAGRKPDPQAVALLGHITTIGNCGGQLAEIAMRMAMGTRSETDGSQERPLRRDLQNFTTADRKPNGDASGGNLEDE